MIDLTASIAEHMNSDLITIDLNSPVTHVEKAFDKHHLHHLPVVSEGKLVGMISLLDFMRITCRTGLAKEEEEINKSTYEAMTVKGLMTENPISLKPSDTLRQAAELFNVNMFHAVPVVNDDNTLVGIITSMDLIKEMLD